MRYVAVTLLLSITACANTSTNGPSIETQVMQAEVALGAAERLALLYVQLPRCGAGAPVLCSNPNVIQQIGNADRGAYAAVVSARANPTASALTAANAAVAAFAAVVPATK